MRVTLLAYERCGGQTGFAGKEGDVKKRAGIFPERLMSIAMVFSLMASSVLWPKAALAGAVFDGKGRIEVTGEDNTLSSIARDVGDPHVFAYDRETRTATSAAGIAVREDAVLVMGVKNDPRAGETLRILCTPELAWGSRAVSVQGVFRMYHSALVGAGPNEETLRYGVYYDHRASGEITDSRIETAHTAVRMQTASEVAIHGLEIVKCTKGLQVQAAAGGLIRGVSLEDTRIAAMVQRSVIFRDCDVGEARIQIQGSRTGPVVTATFVNCRMAPERVTARGDVDRCRCLVKWQQLVQVADEQDYPVAGAYARVVSRVGDMDLPAQMVRTDAAGAAWLDVPECLLTWTGAGAEPDVDAVLNRLDLNTEGAAEQAFRPLKTAWTCEANGGWQFFLLGDGTIKEQPVGFRPGRSGAVTGIVNLCPNSSFEVETIDGFADYWWFQRYFQVREGGLGVVLESRDDPGNELVFFGVDTNHVVHGQRSLQIPPGMSTPVQGIRVDFGDCDDEELAYTVSFYAASDREDNEMYVQASAAFRSMFKVGREMRRYTVVWRVADLDERKRERIRKARHPGYFSFANLGEGKLWLDAVQLEQGSRVHPYVPDDYKAPKH